MVRPLITVPAVTSIVWLVLSDITASPVRERAEDQLCQPRLRSASVLPLIVFLLLRSPAMRN